MNTPSKSGYVKRTQKDYSLSFKLQVVEEIESGQLDRLAAHLKYGIQARSTITSWLRKYGNFDWNDLSASTMSKTPEQRIIELEAKIRLLEKQKARAEHLAERADKKAIIFDMMVDMAEKEFDVAIRKKFAPESSTASEGSKEKR